jgi:hypothetical protein
MFSKEITIIYKESIFGNLSPYKMILRIVVLLLTILNIQKELQAFMKEGLFNFKSAERFKSCGYLFAVKRLWNPN